MSSGSQGSSSSKDEVRPSPYRYMGLPYGKLTKNPITTLPGTLDVSSFGANNFAERLPFQQAVGRGSENVPTRRYFSHSQLSDEVAPKTDSEAVPRKARPSPPPLGHYSPVPSFRRINPKLAVLGCYDTLSPPSTAPSSAGPSRAPTPPSCSASAFRSPPATSLSKAHRHDSLVSLVSLSDACPLLAGPAHFRRQIASSEAIRADDRGVAQLLHDRELDPAQVSQTDRTILWHLVQCEDKNCGGNLSLFLGNSLRWLGPVDDKRGFKMTAEVFIDWLRGKQEGQRLSQSLSTGKAGKTISITVVSGTEGEGKECVCGPNAHEVWCDICCLLRSRGMSEDGMKREDIAHLMLQPGDKRAEALDTLSAARSSASGSEGTGSPTSAGHTVTAPPAVHLRTTIFEPRSADVGVDVVPQAKSRAPPNWLKPKAEMDHPDWLNPGPRRPLPYQMHSTVGKFGQPQPSACPDTSPQAAQALATPVAPVAAGKKSLLSSVGGVFSGYARPRDDNKRLISKGEPQVNVLGSKIIS